MQNYNGNAENGSGPVEQAAIIATEDDGETILMSERANGTEWISAEATLDLEAVR